MDTTLARPAFFSPLWRSWFPGQYYRDLARNGSGVGLLWLFLVTVATSALAVVSLEALAAKLRVDVPVVLKQIPDLTVKEGVFSTPGNTPAKIRLPDTDRDFAVLLPDLDSVPAQYEGVSVVVLKTQIIINKGQGQAPQIYHFDSTDNYTLTQAQMAAGADRIIGFLPWVGGVIYLPLFMVWRVVVWLGLSVAALLTASICGSALTYGALLRVTAAAMTPAIILNTAIGLLVQPRPGAMALTTVVFFGATIILVVLATAAAARTPKPPAGPAGMAPPMGGS